MPTFNGTLYIHAPHLKGGELNTFTCDMSSCGYILLGTHNFSVEYDAPTKDPIEAEIEGLQKQAESIETEALAEVEMINRRISELKCIEYKPEDLS